jgi:hypothetical protein
VTGNISNLSDELEELLINGDEEKIHYIQEMKFSIILQASNIFRILCWNNGNAAPLIEEYFSEIIDNTLKMQANESTSIEHPYPILSPDQSISVALLLAGASKNQPKGQIYKVANDLIVSKAKQVLKNYSMGFDK